MSSNIELWEDLLAWVNSFENGSAANVKLVETPGQLKRYDSPEQLQKILTIFFLAGRGLVARSDLPVRPSATPFQLTCITVD